MKKLRLKNQKLKNPAEEPKAEEPKAEEPKSEVNLSGTAKEILESVKSMTVLELSELVKALQDEFGVVAAAPAALLQQE